MLLDIAKDSLKIMGIFGGYEPHVRLELVNDLINQQSNELKEIEPISPKSHKGKKMGPLDKAEHCTCNMDPCVCWHDEK